MIDYPLSGSSVIKNIVSRETAANGDIAIFSPIFCVRFRVTIYVWLSGEESMI